jgi:hypothetical protein
MKLVDVSSAAHTITGGDNIIRAAPSPRAANTIVSEALKQHCLSTIMK